MTIVLVDGSNVALSESWRRFIDAEDSELGTSPHSDVREHERHLKTRLLDWIMYWAVPREYETVIVFDGAGPLGAGDVAWGTGRVIGAGSSDGDAVVERVAAECVASGRAYRLVTSDAVLRQVAGARAEITMDIESFIAEVTVIEPLPDGTVGMFRLIEHTSTRLSDSLDDETRARLERMRRGDH